MRKALAILATVAAVGATTMTAPAEARGLDPGLAFDLAAGALVAGAAGAYGPYYGPGYGYYGGYYGPRHYGYYGPAYYAPGFTPIMAGRIIATATGVITGNEKSPERCSGLFS